MNNKNRLAKKKLIPGLGVCCALIAGVVAGGRYDRRRRPAGWDDHVGGRVRMAGDDQSGRLRAEGEQSVVPAEAGQRLALRGSKEGMRTTDTVSATQRTKEILGVATTVVHDVV